MWTVPLLVVSGLRRKKFLPCSQQMKWIYSVDRHDWLKSFPAWGEQRRMFWMSHEWFLLTQMLKSLFIHLYKSSVSLSYRGAKQFYWYLDGGGDAKLLKGRISPPLDFRKCFWSLAVSPDFHYWSVYHSYPFSFFV